MDELIISDNILEENISSIKTYCAKQISLVDDFLDYVRSLSDAWDGDNYDCLIDCVTHINKLADQSFSAIRDHYVKHLNGKIELFRTRPTFKGCAPASSSSSLSSSASSSPRTPKSIYDKIFAMHNKDLVTSICFYLRRKNIRFYPPEEGISFYDPDGISKRGLYKNIMGIDINSSQCESDLMSLTGQHIYFQMKRQCKANLARSLNEEMNSVRFAHDVAFQDLTKRIKSGQGINDKYLKFGSESDKVSFHFFANCFKDFMTNNDSEISKYTRYYSNSYRQFQEILANLAAK